MLIDVENLDQLSIFLSFLINKSLCNGIISAVKNRRETKLLAANIPNSGALEEVQPRRLIEAPVQVSEHSLVPARKFQLPHPIISILNLHLDNIEKEKDLIVQAIALDPLTPSPDKAEKIFNLFIKSLSQIEGLLERSRLQS